MSLYHEQFSEVHDFPNTTKPSKYLIIASTPRCGSHMLGHALHETGNFGFPLEYANPANLKEWKKILHKSNLADVINELQRRRTSSNGVFSIKLHYSHLGQFGGIQKVKELFPDAYYVLLTRKKLLKQAISLSIANQTGVWIKGQEPSNRTPKYDYQAIDESLRYLILNNSYWRYSLTANNCNYLELDFETVSKDIPSGINGIANFMGLDVTDMNIPAAPPTVKQATSINTEWEERFLSDFSGAELTCKQGQGIVERVKRRIKKVTSWP